EDAVEHGSTSPRSNTREDAVEHGSTSPRSNTHGDAVEQGTDDVVVRVGTLENGNGIYVEDDGPGIPEENRDRIFSEGYTTSENGSGFGLAIVQQIVDAHNWQIRAIESVDGGARFEISGIETAS
ncbi:Histidine kinase-, DNA gyrase B-, and HSP90-like ATPase, partial [Halopenitus malekzadehii]